MKPETDQLIEAALDGTASSDERATLENLLATDPLARARFDSLGALHRLLERVPPVEPPADLAAALLARLERADRPQERRFDLPLRYAAAFVAGLAITATLYEVSGVGHPDDLAALTGTMVHRGSIETPAVHTAVEAAGVTGRLTVQRSRDLVVLSVELTTDGGTDLVVPLTGATRILGFAGLDGHQPEVTLAAEAFRLQRPAGYRYAIVLQGAGPALTVEFHRDGASVHAADLPVPGV